MSTQNKETEITEEEVDALETKKFICLNIPNTTNDKFEEKNVEYL